MHRPRNATAFAAVSIMASAWNVPGRTAIGLHTRRLYPSCRTTIPDKNTSASSATSCDNPLSPFTRSRPLPYKRTLKRTTFEKFTAAVRVAAIRAEQLLRDDAFDLRRLRYYRPLLNRVRNLKEQLDMYQEVRADPTLSKREIELALDSRKFHPDPPE